MLDAEKKEVMRVLRELTGQDDVYKVIEAEEILEKISPDTPLNKQQLSAIIRDLRDREYLQVKYFTPDEYCLLTMKHTEELAQLVEDVTVAAKEHVQEATEQAAQVPVTKVKVNKISVMIFAFLGGLLGGGIVTAIFVIVQKFLF